MRAFIEKTVNRILNGGVLQIDEAMTLIGLEMEQEEEIELLCQAANQLREQFCGSKADLCTIMNAKSGRCTEDCKFCAQSAYYDADIETYGLVTGESVMARARENELAGVNRFSLVTSGKGMEGADFKRILEIYEQLNDKSSLDLCASLGIIDRKSLKELKKNGVSMYHHNLETSRTYYRKICTTHSYEERIETIKAAKQAGLRICSGGIIGLGESREDRVNMAFELRDLAVDSIPINVLNPIEGTPFESVEPLSQQEILKTIAVYRFIHPTAQIRLAGGRNLIDDYGKKCFLSGANATITGNYLTTLGNQIEDDQQMLKSLGMEISKQL